MPIFFLPSFNVTSFSSFQLFCFYSILFGNCPQLDIPKISSKFSKKVSLLIRTNSRKHSDASHTQFDRSKGSKKKRAIREGRDVRHRSKRNEQTFFSFSSRTRLFARLFAQLAARAVTGLLGPVGQICRASRTPSVIVEDDHLFQTIFTTGLSGLNKRIVNRFAKMNFVPFYDDYNERFCEMKVVQ